MLLIPHFSSDRSFLVVLEINDVVESDAGLYKVRAKNKFGEVAASINLNFSREWTMNNNGNFLANLPFISFLLPPQPWTRPSCREFHLCLFEQLAEMNFYTHILQRENISLQCLEREVFSLQFTEKIKIKNKKIKKLKN